MARFVDPITQGKDDWKDMQKNKIQAEKDKKAKAEQVKNDPQPENE